MLQSNEIANPINYDTAKSIAARTRVPMREVIEAQVAGKHGYAATIYKEILRDVSALLLEIKVHHSLNETESKKAGQIGNYFLAPAVDVCEMIHTRTKGLQCGWLANLLIKPPYNKKILSECGRLFGTSAIGDEIVSTIQQVLECRIAVGRNL